MKHSGAGEEGIRVEKASRGLSLSIRDNGTGFTSEQKTTPIGKGGFGLIGIRERAALLDGVVKNQSLPHVGTLLTIDCDLKKYR